MTGHRAVEDLDDLVELAAPVLEAGGRGPADVEAVARTLLGTLAEPGDGVLGSAVQEVGAPSVARVLLRRPDEAQLSTIVPPAARERPTTLRDALARWMPRLDVSDYLRSLEQAERVGARLLIPGDRFWPAGVDDLEAHAPLALWVRGDVGALGRRIRSIALVGARAATGYGEHVVIEAAAGLADRGFAIVSGGAYGIDGMAHRSALRSDGTTIAFLAGGIDRFYPLGHEALLTRIVDQGAVVSEAPCGLAPTKWRFLARNRLIAAAADATVVVEAGHRSGSINTAGHAAQLGRPLGAVPGPVTSPASAGCHRLMREYGAVCVVDADQMAELAGGVASPAFGHGAGPGGDGGVTRPGRSDAAVDPEHLRVADGLSHRTPREVEEVARRSGLEPRQVMAALGGLEAAGRAERRPTGWIAQRPH